MIKLILSLDYEINGNGTGDPMSLMVDPTRRLLETADQYGAKITIFAETAELLAMKKIGEYGYVVETIEDQLKKAIEAGHDVQLHLHPQWIDPVFRQGRWHLDLDKVSIPRLTYDEMNAFIREGKRYLEDILTPADSSYRCNTFRAGYWCMMPSFDILTALKQNGFLYDSSVFKWGFEDGPYVSYDYRSAHSNLLPWYVDLHDINRSSGNPDHLCEIPIYTEHVHILSMVTSKRLLSRSRGKETRNDLNPAGKRKPRDLINLLFRKHPKKLDFCKLTFREMKGMIDRIVRKVQGNRVVPVCAIGHSKEFSGENDLDRFLDYVGREYPGLVETTTFKSLYSITEKLEFSATGSYQPSRQYP